MNNQLSPVAPRVQDLLDQRVLKNRLAARWKKCSNIKIRKNILDNDWKEWLESRKNVLCFIVFVCWVVELTDFCQFVLLAAGHG